MQGRLFTILILYCFIQASSTLQPYVNIIEPKDFGTESMFVKGYFTQLTTDLLIGMCRGITYAEDSLVARTDLGNLKVTKDTFATVDVTSLSLNCEKNCSTPAEVLFGKNMSDAYTSWNCGGDGDCIGKTLIGLVFIILKFVVVEICCIQTQFV